MGVLVEDMVAELRPYVSGAADFTIEDALRRTMDEFYTESRSWLSVTRAVWPGIRRVWFGVCSITSSGVDLVTDYVPAKSNPDAVAPSDWPMGVQPETYTYPFARTLLASDGANFDFTWLPSEPNGCIYAVFAQDGDLGPLGVGYNSVGYDALDYTARAPAFFQAPDGSPLEGVQMAAALWVGLMDDDGERVTGVLADAATLDSLDVRKARPRGAPRFFVQHDGSITLDPLPADGERVNLMVACALKPTPAATEIPDDAMGTNRTYIVEGALAYLCRMPNQAWTSQAASEKYMHRFKQGIAEARGEAQRKWSPQVDGGLALGSFDMYRKAGT